MRLTGRIKEMEDLNDMIRRQSESRVNTVSRINEELYINDMQPLDKAATTTETKRAKKEMLDRLERFDNHGSSALQPCQTSKAQTIFYKSILKQQADRLQNVRSGKLKSTDMSSNNYLVHIGGMSRETLDAKGTESLTQNFQVIPGHI